MISRAYLEGFEPRASTDVNAYLFQPLLPGHRRFDPADRAAGRQPQLAEPAGRARRALEPQRQSARHRSRGRHPDPPAVARLANGTAAFRDGLGGQYNFSASVRGDGYSIGDLSAVSNPELPSAFFPANGQPALAPTPTSFVTGRAFPQVGLVWSYPLIHRGESTTQLIEPIVGGFAAPSSGNRRNIPNEDSLSFRAHRHRSVPARPPGGLRHSRYRSAGRLRNQARALRQGGRQLPAADRAELSRPAQPFLPPGSGAEKRLSDVVGRMVLSPNSYLDLIYRFRFDTSPLSNRNQQVGISAGPQSLRVSRQFCLSSGATAERGRDQPDHRARTCSTASASSSRSALTAKLTRYWSMQASETINLTNSTDARQQRAVAAGVERQPLRILVGDLSGRMHGVYRRGDAIGDPQRRRDARVFRAVQRRLQESRRDRRHCRLHLRGCLP